MAGKKYSDIFATSNTANVADTDLFALQRTDGNTYILRANTLYNYVSNKVLSNRNVNYVNTATFAANSSHDVILCNPEEAINTITVTLPAGSNNKQYTVKCINSVSYGVVVTTSNTAQTTIENATGGTIGTSVTLSTNGQVVTWISWSGTYRKIS
jgi:hypothetical protein